MNWFIFALLAALFFSSQRIIARFLLRKQGNPIAFTICHHIIAGVVLIPTFFFFDFNFPTQSKTWWFYAIATLFYTFGDIYTYKAIKELSVSTWQILTQVRHIFVLFGGFLLYTESLDAIKIMGITMIIIGAIITMYQKVTLSVKGYSWIGVLFTVIAAFFVASGSLVDKTIIQDFSMPLYVSLNLISISVVATVYLLMKKETRSIYKEYKLHGYWIIFAALFFGMYKLFLILAINIGEVSRVIPVSQAALIFTVIAGIIFLKEYERLPQKVIGVIIMIAGILSLYLI